MIKSRWNRLAALLALMTAAMTVHAAPSAAAAAPSAPAAPKLTDQVAAILPLCASCHGVDGISSVALYPNLAGQKPEYLAKQLRDYKAARRDDAVMRPMAEPLDDAAIEALSRHFGAMPGAR
ncbi:Cytochrome c553 [Ralstonia sp. 25mfcol4.1]|uniref:c-type cytochrome n=1 Tax=Ralstonia sp. 25mfcol4.1 TaxID=1761899 RepID=UPI000890F965|nr:c-type cytochrome [Ralstonia sp. 25mfcol4.1]SDP82097.1 Cytochrome c553 [Ralstonia sp. 25mfcol4.1]